MNSRWQRLETPNFRENCRRNRFVWGRVHGSAGASASSIMVVRPTKGRTDGGALGTGWQYKKIRLASSQMHNQRISDVGQ